MTVDGSQVSNARRWAMLAVSTLAQATSAIVIHGPAFLIPTLHQTRGISLASAGLVAAAPTMGVVLSLVAWGYVVDRRGERSVLLAGLLGSATFSALAALSTHSMPMLGFWLLLAGACAASCNSASGRVVVGWFPPHRRGLAMGIRQMAQPAGVGIAAISIAVIAGASTISAALWVPTVSVVVGAGLVALVVIDPPRPSRAELGADNPYRDGYLTRIHAVSVLLVVPQFLVWTFGLAWLVSGLGWHPATAGTVVALAQVVGAGSRIVVGHLSDLVGSRMRVLRWVGIAGVGVMVALGLSAAGSGQLVESASVVLLVLATAVTVADNGLAFTAVAERAGARWSGRALGIQNTAQYLAASAVPPVAGLLVAEVGYSAAFALAALFPLVGVGFVPVKGERPLA